MIKLWVVNDMHDLAEVVFTDESDALEWIQYHGNMVVAPYQIEFNPPVPDAGGLYLYYGTGRLKDCYLNVYRLSNAKAGQEKTRLTLWAGVEHGGLCGEVFAHDRDQATELWRMKMQEFKDGQFTIMDEGVEYTFKDGAACPFVKEPEGCDCDLDLLMHGGCKCGKG